MSPHKKILTLCVVHDDKQILLGLKKRGFGEGKWNGFGGKVQEGEGVEEAARRELREEAGIDAQEMRRRGVIAFEFSGNPEILEVHIFSCSDFSGEPRESDEMRPRLFNLGEIPYGSMWPDDKYWLPMLLAGKNFKGKFFFEEQDKIAEFDLEEVAPHYFS